MRDYLNSEEKLSIIAMLKIAERTEGFISGNVFDKKEKSDLKRSVTYMAKSVESMLKRLNRDSIKAFNKAIEQTKVYVSSESEIEVYRKRKSADIEKSYEENKEYFNLVELIIDQNCKACTKCGNECPFYKEFEENCIPEFEEGGVRENCKYSY